jgi:hypothetical protein
MRSLLPACGLAAFALSAASAAAAAGEGVDGPGPGICAFSGWSSDRDPAGLNVRAAPSANAAIVGRLPPPEHIEDRDFATEFDVLESRDGWFRIANARRWSEESAHSASLPSGWISGRFLRFALQTDRAFASPDPNSQVVAFTWRDGSGTIQPFAYRHPTACRGEWVKLTVVGHDGREREGWVRGICGIQETTCDGVQGDMVDYDDLPVR